MKSRTGYILAGWLLAVLAWIFAISLYGVNQGSWHYVVLLVIMAAFTILGIVVTARTFRRLRNK